MFEHFIAAILISFIIISLITFLFTCVFVIIEVCDRIIRAIFRYLLGVVKDLDGED